VSALADPLAAPRRRLATWTGHLLPA